MPAESDERTRPRDAVARAIGVAVALASMALAWHAIGWPAPGISVALGVVAWLAARPRPA